MVVAVGDSLTGALAVAMTWWQVWPWWQVAVALGVVALAWPLMLAVRAGDVGPVGRRRPYGDVLGALAGLIAVVALGGSVLGYDLLGVPLVAASAILAGGSIVVRVGAGRRLRALRRRGLAMTRTLVIGPASGVSAVVERLARDESHPLTAVAGWVEDGGTVSAASVPVVGGEESDLPDGDPFGDDAPIRRVGHAVGQVAADAVCVAPGSRFTGDRLRALGWALDDLGVDLVTDLGLCDVAMHRVRLGTVGTGAFAHVKRTRPTGALLLAKVVVDRVLAGVALLLLSPLLLTIAFAVRASSPGPAIYRQVRVGRDGLLFTMLKFRTMHVDADLRRAELLGFADGDGPMFKMRDDPRITRVGRVLRTYSLDELPQLINVLRGEMSLVGPRPPLPEEVATYDATERRRLRAIPGMTGLWQVSGRSNLTWQETVRLDLRYVDNWSLSEDVRLLARTAGAVVRGNGAY